MTDRPPGPPEPPGGWIEVDPLPPPPPRRTFLPGPLPYGSFPPPGPPPGPGTREPPPERGAPWVLVLAAVFAVVGIIALFLATVGGSDPEPEVAGAEDGAPDHPDEWDPRVLDLVRFVQEERGLTFEHPVQVDFLDEAAWVEETDVDEEEILDEDAQLLEHGAGLFRSIGLAEGELDLLGDSETLGTSGTVGRYSFEDERITVRGTELTPKVEATMVHELTHVLQDQHYDIGDRIQALTEEDTDEESLRVLVEGDADRVEDIWIDSLSADERDALDDERAEESSTAQAALEELPASLVTFFASDYILGAGFMDVLEASDGVSAINDAFADPPGPEEHVFDPISYLERDAPEAVEPPDVDGEAIEDLDGDFGAVGWYLMLAERIDPQDALAAVDGWGGDAFVGYRDGDRTSAAVRFVGEDVAAAEAMEVALADWVEAMPAESDAAVEISGDRVALTTCDPGTDAELLEGNGRSQETISLLATRATLATEVLSGGGSPAQARCFSRGLIAELDYELLIASDPTAAQQEQIQQVALEQGARCR